jgi:hypothetical protein
MVTLASISAMVIIAFLGWTLFQRVSVDGVERLNNRRRASSRLVSRGEFVDGGRRQAVALALTRSTFIYENADIQSSLDLRWVREIEYDSDLATGLSAGDGTVLRMRAQSRTFEFILPPAMVAQWQNIFPPRQAFKPVAVRYGRAVEVTAPKGEI